MAMIVQLLLILLLAATQVSAGLAGHGVLQESLFKEFGRLLERAIDNLGGAEEPAPAAMAAVQVDAGAALTEREQKDFRDRISAHAAVVGAWLASRCELTAEQQDRVARRAVELAEQHAAKLTVPREPRHGNNLPLVLPVMFAMKDGPADQLADQLLQDVRAEVLTPEQKETLESALQEREAAHTAAWVDYLTAMLDEELFLSNDQRNRIRDELAAREAGLLHPLYSFQPQTYYLPYEPLHTLLPVKVQRDVLDRRQRDRLRDIENGTSGNQHLTFMSNTGPEEWGRQIRDSSQAGQAMLMRAAEVRIAWLQREYGLSEQQCERLRLAGKGATVRAIDDWKESTQLTIEQMQQQMAQFRGNFGFGVQALDIRSLENSEIWTRTLEEVARGTGQGDLPDRNQQLREATAASLTALLDQELWLLPEQRDALRPLVLEAVPRNLRNVRNQEYIREIMLIACPLFRIPSETRENVLTEPQRTVWDGMQLPFQWQKGNNYVQIQLRNGGGSFSFMLE